MDTTRAAFKSALTPSFNSAGKYLSPALATKTPVHPLMTGVFYAYEYAIAARTHPYSRHAHRGR